MVLQQWDKTWRWFCFRWQMFAHSGVEDSGSTGGLSDVPHRQAGYISVRHITLKHSAIFYSCPSDANYTGLDSHFKTGAQV